MPDGATSDLAGQRALQRLIEREQDLASPQERQQTAGAIERMVMEQDRQEREAEIEAIRRAREEELDIAGLMEPQLTESDVFYALAGPPTAQLGARAHATPAPPGVGPERLRPPEVPIEQNPWTGPVQAPLLPGEREQAVPAPEPEIPEEFLTPEARALRDLQRAPVPEGAPAPTLEGPPARAPGAQPGTGTGDVQVSDRPTGQAPDAGDPHAAETTPSAITETVPLDSQNFVFKRDGEAVAVLTAEMISAAGGNVPLAIRNLPGLSPAERLQFEQGVYRFGRRPQAPAAGPRGPRGELVETFRATAAGPVSETALGEAEAATAARRMAEAERTGLDVQRLELQAQNAVDFAERMAAQAAQRAKEQADIAGQVRTRMDQLDGLMANVREQRVDPEAFFGGSGGRIGATIAVALGQLGAALTGGENTALQIIQAGIDRNIRAQEHNIQAGLRGAGQAMNALQMFRQLTGDEQAARDYARAAELEAVAARLRGEVAQLDPARLQAGRNLLAAIQREAAAHGAVAAERANNTLTTEFTNRTVARGGEAVAARRAVEHRMSVSDARTSAADAVAGAETVQDPEQRGELSRRAVSDAQRLARLGDFEAATEVLGRLMAAEGATPEEREALEQDLINVRREEVRQRGLRVGPGLYSTSRRARQVGERIASGTATPADGRFVERERQRIERHRARRRARRARGPVRRPMLNLSGLPEDMEASAQLMRQLGQIMSEGPAAAQDSFSEVVPGQEHIANNLTAEQQQQLASVRVLYETIHDLSRRAVRFREENRVNILDAQEATDLRSEWEAFGRTATVAFAGTTFTEGILEMMGRSYPDPTEQTLGRAIAPGVGTLDETLRIYRGLPAVVEREAARVLRSLGRRIRTPGEAARPRGQFRRTQQEEVTARRRRQRRAPVRGPE